MLFRQTRFQRSYPQASAKETLRQNRRERGIVWPNVEMRHPDVIAEYVKTYHEERKRLAMVAAKQRSRRERRITEIRREIDRLVDGIAKGLGGPHILGDRMLDDRMKVLVRERSELTAELEAATAAENAVALHRATLARCEQQLARLQEALGKGVREGDSEAAGAIRDLAETVTVYRDPSRPAGVEVEVEGRLTALLGKRPFRTGSGECGERW